MLRPPRPSARDRAAYMTEAHGLTVLEAGSSRSGCVWGGLVSSEASARGCVLTRWSLCVCACVCVLIDSSNTDASHLGRGPSQPSHLLTGSLSPNNLTLRSSGSNRRILGGQSPVHNRSVRKRALLGEGRGPPRTCMWGTDACSGHRLYLSFRTNMPEADF